MTGRRTAWLRRRPYDLVGGFFLLAALQLLATVLRPPLATTDIQWQATLLVITLVLLVVTAAAALLDHRDRSVPVLVMGGVVLVAASTYGAAGGQGQLVAAGYLTLLGLIAGLSLAGRWLVAVLGIGSVLYFAAIVGNPRLDSLSYGVGLIALFILVGAVVGRLVGQLRERATRDPLTGVLNRHGLDETAATAHDRDVRAHQQTTIVEIDLDGFKAYNDTHGHQAGDELLASLTDAWRTELRHTDILARIGGDEFVLVLPATSTEEAHALVARMRAANAAPWTYGLVAWKPGEPLPAAMRHADMAMYAHKPDPR